MLRSRLIKCIWIVSFIFVLYASATILESDYWGNILSPVCAGIATVLMFYVFYSRKNKQSTTYIFLLQGIACFAWTIADILWAILAFMGREPDRIQTITFIYALPNVFFLSGLVYFLFMQFRKWNGLQLLLDTMAVSLSGILLLWIVFFRKSPYYLQMMLEKDFVSIVSICTDFFIVVGLTMWYFSIRSGKIPAFIRIGSFGLALYAIADLYYYYKLFYDDYNPNTYVDLIYMIAIMLIALGAIWRPLTNKGSEFLTLYNNVGMKQKGIYLLCFPIITIIVEGFILNDVLLFVLIMAIYETVSSHVQIGIHNERLFKREQEINRELEKRVAEQTSELAFLSNQDTVTKLYNRRYFTNVLETTINNLKPDETMALMFIDADRFKTINDTYGHDIGDKVLIEISNRMFDYTNNKAVLARLGGDEFVLLLHGNYTHSEIEVFTQEIIDICSKPILIDQYVLNITISIGVALCPNDTSDIVTLMKYADIAMYRAKSQGYNRYTFFDPFINEKVREKNEIEILLRNVNVLEDFKLYYQPQFTIQNSKLIGAEALIRWENSEHGFIPPNVFIPVAEEIGYIKKIGEWVMEEVYQQSILWHEKYAVSLKVGMNVSTKQLDSDDFIQQIMRLCEKNQSFSGLMDVEITESFVLADEERIKEIFNVFKTLGISVSIDDFGAGYSSLSYLKTYPFDRIKIDKSLIDNIATNENDMLIVKAIVSMAKAIGIKTIAEGVETTDQLFVLAELGCDQVQGYLLGRPVPAGVFEKMFIMPSIDKIYI